jgi:hypothetical protein
MAKFTSHVYSEIRGSISGTTYSRNRFGQYVRRRAVPAQPRTPFQMSVRSFFGSVASRWRDLPQDSQALWRAFAERIVRTDSLGNPIRLTGLQAFVMINALRRVLGLPVTPNAPPDVGTPPAIATLILSIDTTVNEMEVQFTPTPLAGAIVIEATPPQSAGVNSVGRSKFRFVRMVKPGSFGGTITSPQNIWTQYVERFGIPPHGSKVFVRVVPVDYASADTAGFAGPPITASTVVVR